MPELFSSLIVFLITLVGIVLLGLIAGFSPTLYIAQITAGSRSKNESMHSYVLMAGVLSAILVLSFLFQIVQLDVLVEFIDSTLKALIISLVFNVFIGIGLVVGGFWYINRRPASRDTVPLPKKQTRNQAALFSFGFVRTFTSISGLTATYAAGNAIASASSTILEQVVYTLIFLAATIIPFVSILILTKRDSGRLKSLVAELQGWLKRVNYQLVIGSSAILFGGSVVIVHGMMALFY